MKLHLIKEIIKMEYLHLTKKEATVIWDISSLNKIELKELIDWLRINDFDIQFKRVVN